MNKKINKKLFTFMVTTSILIITTGFLVIADGLGKDSYKESNGQIHPGTPKNRDKIITGSSLVGAGLLASLTLLTIYLMMLFKSPESSRESEPLLPTSSAPTLNAERLFFTSSVNKTVADNTRNGEPDASIELGNLL